MSQFRDILINQTSNFLKINGQNAELWRNSRPWRSSLTWRGLF